MEPNNTTANSDPRNAYPAWTPSGTHTPSPAPQTPQQPPTAAAGAVPPHWLLTARRWLLWRSEAHPDPAKKPRKVPYYVSGGKREGTLDTAEDAAKLVGFAEAFEQLNRLPGAYAGLALALGPDGTGSYFQGIDLDDVLTNKLNDLATSMPGYVEYSPSRSGCHAIGYGRAFETLGSNSTGIEAYCSGRFFTFTSSVVRYIDPSAPPVDLAEFVEQALAPRHGGKRPSRGASTGFGASDEGAEVVTSQQVTELRSALNMIPAHDRSVWVEVGMALKGLGAVGWGLWVDWSQSCPEQWNKGGMLEAAERWDTFEPRSITYRSVFDLAQKLGWVNPASKGAQIAEPEPTAEDVAAARQKADQQPQPAAGGLSDFEPPRMTVADMLAELVFVADGEFVAMRRNPRIRGTTKAMRTKLLSNKTILEAKEPGKKDEECRTFDLWLASPMRETVHTFAFDPSQERLFRDANGIECLNLWVPPLHTVPQDWQERARPFVDHVRYLLPVAAEAERFLDFLAHIQQRPGELPHSGWLLISKLEGTGRGMLFRWLDKVWPGYVQQSLELGRVLTDNFTDELSQKLLLVVDEIDEGSAGAMWKLRPVLKRFMTAPVRHMNPKTFRRYTERNVARMAICSNELTALPIDPRDRRLWVSHNASAPGPAHYYTELGALERDPMFIASVWQCLRTRDLSKYDPHERPVMNEAKAKVIANTQTREVELAHDVAKTWHRDLITGTDLCHELYGPEPTNAEKGQLKFRANDIGAMRWTDNGNGLVRLHGRSGPKDTVWILRNHDRWSAAPLHEVQRELARPPA